MKLRLARITSRHEDPGVRPNVRVSAARVGGGRGATRPRASGTSKNRTVCVRREGEAVLVVQCWGRRGHTFAGFRRELSTGGTGIATNFGLSHATSSICFDEYAMRVALNLCPAANAVALVPDERHCPMTSRACSIFRRLPCCFLSIPTCSWVPPTPGPKAGRLLSHQPHARRGEPEDYDGWADRGCSG